MASTNLPATILAKGQSDDRRRRRLGERDRHSWEFIALKRPGKKTKSAKKFNRADREKKTEKKRMSK